MLCNQLIVLTRVLISLSTPGIDIWLGGLDAACVAFIPHWRASVSQFQFPAHVHFGRQQVMAQVLGSLYPPGKLRLSSRLLPSTWHNPSWCGHLGSQAVCVCVCESVSSSLLQHSNKMKISNRKIMPHVIRKEPVTSLFTHLYMNLLGRCSCCTQTLETTQ